MGASLKTDYTGRQFNSWKIIKRVPNNLNRNAKWLCRCTRCGAETTVQTPTLKKGWSKSRYCEKCARLALFPEIMVYLQYHPDAQLRSSNIIFRLDGNQNNLAKDNLYLTSAARVHWADLKMPNRFGMYGYHPELVELRRSALMLVDLECMAFDKDNDHKSWDVVYEYKTNFS